MITQFIKLQLVLCSVLVAVQAQIAPTWTASPDIQTDTFELVFSSAGETADKDMTINYATSFTGGSPSVLVGKYASYLAILDTNMLGTGAAFGIKISLKAINQNSFKADLAYMHGVTIYYLKLEYMSYANSFSDLHIYYEDYPSSSFNIVATTINSPPSATRILVENNTFNPGITLTPISASVAVPYLVGFEGFGTTYKLNLSTQALSSNQMSLIATVDYYTEIDRIIFYILVANT